MIETEMMPDNPRATPALIPVGRFGTVDEVADVVVMLATNGYITGQTINVNGGWYIELRGKLADEPDRQHGSHYGIIYAIAAYGSWGLFPLYFKAVAGVAPVEVLAHRGLWSFAVLAVLVAFLGRWTELGRELQSGKLLLMLGLSTLLISANWLVFIYAVVSGQVLQASLGYFINPLVNVLLGVVFPRAAGPRQTLSIMLALVGVLVLAGFVGGCPGLP